MRLSDFAERLDDRLRTPAFSGIDASANGVQVGPAGAAVDHVAFAVDAAHETIERAVEAGADLLVTHHGLIWGGLDRLTGREYERVAPLVENDLALYVSHLPLDAHPSLGNAAGICDLFDLEGRAPFGALGDEHVGMRGRAPASIDRDDLVDVLSAELDTGDGRVRLLGFGTAEIDEVAVLTGAGADWLAEADRVGADVLVTGEGKGRLYHEAREAEMNVILAGLFLYALIKRSEI